MQDISIVTVLVCSILVLLSGLLGYRMAAHEARTIIDLRDKEIAQLKHYNEKLWERF